MPGGLFHAIGTPLADGARTYTWQNGRQLASMSKSGETVSFVYNENGLRVQKIATSTGTTNYTLHDKNIVHMKQGSNNLQGDIVSILDSNKNVVVNYVYDAWGRPISCSGTMASTLGKINPFWYRGYVYDEETEEYYLCTRYYSPEMMRFVNSDLIINQDAVLGGNCYCYVSNSPICCIDDSGAIVFTLVGGLIGFGCQAVSALCQGNQQERLLRQELEEQFQAP